MDGAESVTAAQILGALAEIGFNSEGEKTADRLRALELCGKLLGIFGRDIEPEAPSAPPLSMAEKAALVVEAARQITDNREQISDMDAGDGGDGGDG